MAKGSASELLVRKAQQDLRSCQAYLTKHFARPANRTEKRAKNLATRHVWRLMTAIRDRDATAIARESQSLSKVVIYLWSIKQFGSKGDH